MTNGVTAELKNERGATLTKSDAQIKMSTTTEQIRTSDSKNKTAEYIALAKFYAADSVDTADTTGNIFVQEIAKEISLLSAKANTADCEYTAYANCHAAEVWFSKIDEQF